MLLALALPRILGPLPAFSALPTQGDALIQASTGEDREVDLSNGEGAMVALTFDDGPRRSTTGPLLEGLAERGVHATFFLVGEMVEGNEDLVEQMAAQGHQIGVHT